MLFALTSEKYFPVQLATEDIRVKSETKRKRKDLGQTVIYLCTIP